MQYELSEKDFQECFRQRLQINEPEDLSSMTITMGKQAPLIFAEKGHPLQQAIRTISPDLQPFLTSQYHQECHLVPRPTPRRRYSRPTLEKHSRD